MAFLDFLRPRWRHPNAEIRLEVIAKMGEADLDKLLLIVREDEEPRVRLAALERIENPTVLEELARADLAPPLPQVIQRKLNQFRKEQVLAAPPAAAADRLAGITDENVLAELAVDEKLDPELRGQAVAAIQRPELLARVTEQNCGKVAALAAVERITDEALLRRVAQNASSKPARSRAEEKLAALEAERNKPTPEQLRQQALTALVARAEQLAESYNWDYVEGQFDEIQQQWLPHDPERTDPLYARVVTARERFGQRRTEFQRRQEEEQRVAAERAAAAAEQAAAVARREEACQQLEALRGSLDPAAEERCRQLEAAWPDAGAPPPGPFPELSERFAAAGRRFRETAAAIAAERAVLATLGDWCAQAEELSRAEDLEASGEQLAALAPRVAAVRLVHLTAGDLPAQFAAARNRWEERRRAGEQAREEAAQQNLAQREALLKEVEALVEAEDRVAAEKRGRELQSAWDAAPACPGKRGDELARRWRQAQDQFHKHQREFREEQEWMHWANKGLKEELCQQVEALAAEQDLHQVAKLIKEAQAKWKEVGPAGRHDDEVLWRRFHQACEQNFARCKVFFEELDRQRAANLVIKEKICVRAEELAESGEWKATAEELKALQTQWKETGPAKRGAEEELFQRFRKACDRFFERRRLHFEEQEQQREESKHAKELLCEEVEKLVAEPRWDTREQVKALQAKWKEAGTAPRELEQPLWERFRAACDRYFRWLDEQRPLNLARKGALCAELEALLAGITEQSDLRQVAEHVVALQQQWKETGPVPPEKAEELWHRFHNRCDEFFASRREHFERLEKQRQESLVKKEELLARVQALSQSEDWQETAEEIRQLQEEWRQLGPAPRPRERELWVAFSTACDQFFTRRREHFAEMDRIRQENLRARETLCARLETLVGISSDQSGGAAGERRSTLSLAEELKLAFETNFITAGQQSSPVVREEVRSIQQQWREIGPVPREHEQPLRDRFRRALDQFYGQRPGGRDDAPAGGGRR